MAGKTGRIPRVFVPSGTHKSELSSASLFEHLTAKSSLTLDPEQSHYLIRVLRLNADDQLIIFDGKRNDHAGKFAGFYGEYMASITRADKRACEVSIESYQPKYSSINCLFSVALGLSKGDRLEWAIQKSVELGVNEIVLVANARSQVQLNEKKLSHLNGVARAACEQSGRCEIPLIRTAQSLAQHIESAETAAQKLLALADFKPDDLQLEQCYFDHRAHETLSLWLDRLVNIGSTTKHGAPLSAKVISLAIGPEGGFSDGERALLKDARYVALSLGPRVLRAETAPVVALSILQHRLGDLG